MSYCRSSERDSDIYLIGSRTHLECFGAGWKLELATEGSNHEVIDAPSWGLVNGEATRLEGQTHKHPISFTTTSRQEMIDHLLRHRELGHKVPKRAIKRLEREIKEKGDIYEPA